MDFSRIPPSATIKVEAFRAHAEEEQLQHMRELLKLSPVGRAVFENTENGRRYGMNRDWLTKVKDYWLSQFDWRKHEERINSFPNFRASITDDGDTTEVHFVALFSEKSDAIPIAFFHGWPGSFLEFLDLLDILRKRYSPADLPYHVIVPSLPGYAYSSGPPSDKDYSTDQATRVLDKLLTGLGFNAYLAQGGDIGSTVARLLAANYPSCKGMHLNMIGIPPPPNAEDLPVDDLEKRAMTKGEEFSNTDTAYALEHGQRTATIGLALSSSPLALLSWIGEKFLEWTDEDPPIDKILESVTLYWLTETFPRCIYPYRGNGAGDAKPRIAQMKNFGKGGRPTAYVDKPSGYSLFLHDILHSPRSWAATSCDLVSYNQHERGGHFAAMEKPTELLADVEEWIQKAWKPEA